MEQYWPAVFEEPYIVPDDRWPEGDPDIEPPNGWGNPNVNILADIHDYMKQVRELWKYPPHATSGYHNPDANEVHGVDVDEGYVASKPHPGVSYLIYPRGYGKTRMVRPPEPDHEHHAHFSQKKKRELPPRLNRGTGPKEVPFRKRGRS